MNKNNLWSTGRTTDHHFDRIHNPWLRNTTKVVAVLTIVAVIFVGGAIISKATAVCAPNTTAGCPAPKVFAAKKYRHDKMGHAVHARTGAYFKHPKYAHKVIHRKVVKAVRRAGGAGSAGVSTVKHYMTSLWSNADCVGHGSYQPYSSGFDLCAFNGPKMTKEDVQDLGTAVLCGTGVALVAIDGAGLAILAVAGSSCAWGVWLSESS